MRGALLGHLHSRVYRRIIPADAGSTIVAEAVTAKGQDHPRRCGEHARPNGRALFLQGSSPQMRGAPKYWNIQRFENGIIPADAGSTAGWRTRSSPRWDHPRRCGEHLQQHAILLLMNGSSPQMRGAQLLGVAERIEDGIIPADAGSTSSGS